MTTKIIRWKLPSTVLAAILLDPKTASGALTDLMQLSTTTITAVPLRNDRLPGNVLDNDAYTTYRSQGLVSGEVF